MSEIIKGRKEATKISSFLIFEISVYFHIKKIFFRKIYRIIVRKVLFRVFGKNNLSFNKLNY